MSSRGLRPVKPGVTKVRKVHNARNAARSGAGGVNVYDAVGAHLYCNPCCDAVIAPLSAKSGAYSDAP